MRAQTPLRPHRPHRPHRLHPHPRTAPTHTPAPFPSLHSLVDIESSYYRPPMRAQTPLRPHRPHRPHRLHPHPRTAPTHTPAPFPSLHSLVDRKFLLQCYRPPMRAQTPLRPHRPHRPHRLHPHPRTAPTHTPAPFPSLHSLVDRKFLSQASNACPNPPPPTPPPPPSPPTPPPPHGPYPHPRTVPIAPLTGR